VKYERCALYL